MEVSCDAGDEGFAGVLRQNGVAFDSVSHKWSTPAQKAAPAHVKELTGLRNVLQARCQLLASAQVLVIVDNQTIYKQLSMCLEL